MQRRWLVVVLFVLLGLVGVPTMLLAGPPRNGPQALVEVARQVYTQKQSAHAAGVASVEEVHLWSARWRDAAMAAQGDPEGRRAALQGHADRMRALRLQTEQRVQGGEALPGALDEALYFQLEAARRLQEGR